MKNGMNIGWRKIYQDDNFDLSSLEKPFPEQEIKEAIFELPKNKSSGLDGFPSSFFQKFWFIIKNDLYRLFNIIHSNFTDLDRLNYTHMILISKKNYCQSVRDFRSIILINGVMKIVSKLFTKRLSKYILSLISDFQSTFIQGRQITDYFALPSRLISY